MALVEQVRASAYTVPTDGPESDGTFEWHATTVVVVEARAGEACGVGYSYTAASAADLVGELLADRVVGLDALDVPRAWEAMVGAVRNAGRPGLASTAISAVDAALWDLKARLLGLPLADLLGSVRSSIGVYGSGGFTSYTPSRLAEQLEGWAAEGITAVKMKVGRHPDADAERVRVARRAVGDKIALFVDANGAHGAKEALAQAVVFADAGVTWFEEPVSSDDLAGLGRVRDHGPPGVEVAAGEYGYDLAYFRRMLEAGAVDVLQADATRCGGITGFLRVGALCEAFGVALSAHTAPALHVALGCALQPVRHLEWFHDHARVEALLFDGAPVPVDGRLHPDRTRPGLGLEFKRADAERFAAGNRR